MEATIPLFLCMAYVVLALLAILQHVLREHSGEQRAVEIIGMCVWLLFSLLFFGGRGETLGTDTAAYIQHAQGIEVAHYFDPAFEPGYNLLVYCIVSLVGSNHLLAVIELIYVLLILLACRLWFANQSLLGLLALVSVFSYYNLAVNLIRSGLAISLWLCGLSLSLKRKKHVAGLSLYSLAFLIHFSVAVPILASLVANYVRNRLLRWVLIFAIALEFVFGRFSEQILATGSQFPLLGRYVERYIGREITYRVGFRFDFLAYCMLFYVAIWLGLKILANGTRTGGALNGQVTIAYTLFRNYTMLFAIFVLSFGLPYSDRSGTFAFVIAPVACLYTWLRVLQQWRSQRLFIGIWLCCCAHFACTLVYLHMGGTW